MKRQIGDFGENLAENYLKKRGWRILSRNYNVCGGEIDIIGFRGGVLVYFEVKTRRNDSYGKPSESVDEAKIGHINKAVRAFEDQYLKNGKVPVFYPFGLEIKRTVRKRRIDVIEVYLNQKSQQINHIKNWGSKL